jgi:pyrroloquinoline quinone biosynthesis protein D
MGMPEASYAYPKLARKARLRHDGLSGATFLLYPERGLRLNDSAAAILALCDGHRSMAEIARLVSAGSGVASPDAEKDVAGFLDRLAQRGLLECAV